MCNQQFVCFLELDFQFEILTSCVSKQIAFITKLCFGDKTLRAREFILNNIFNFKEEIFLSKFEDGFKIYQLNLKMNSSNCFTFPAQERKTKKLNKKEDTPPVEKHCSRSEQDKK